MRTPPPVIGSSRVTCPGERMVANGILPCRWRRRLASPRAFRAYRRHWARRHA